MAKYPTEGFERTLVIIKPDALQRRLVGEVIQRFERKGLKIVGLKMLRISEEMAREHYKVHEGKPFYEPLVRYMTSGPCVAMVVEGMKGVGVARKLAGTTFAAEADPGTIRGDLALSYRFNIVHCADSNESADREIRILFGKEELLDYEMSDYPWVYDFSTGEAV